MIGEVESYPRPRAWCTPGALCVSSRLSLGACERSVDAPEKERKRTGMTVGGGSRLIMQNSTNELDVITRCRINDDVVVERESANRSALSGVIAR